MQSHICSVNERVCVRIYSEKPFEASNATGFVVQVRDATLSILLAETGSANAIKRSFRGVNDSEGNDQANCFLSGFTDPPGGQNGSVPASSDGLLGFGPAPPAQSRLVRAEPPLKLIVTSIAPAFARRAALCPKS